MSFNEFAVSLDKLIGFSCNSVCDVNDAYKFVYPEVFGAKSAMTHCFHISGDKDIGKYATLHLFNTIIALLGLPLTM